jgi:hypothetical protein
MYSWHMIWMEPSLSHMASDDAVEVNCKSRLGPCENVFAITTEDPSNGLLGTGQRQEA